MADIGWGEEEWDYSDWDSNDAVHAGNTETTEAEVGREEPHGRSGLRRKVGWRLELGQEIR